jgi:hypothetical protein
MSRAVDKMAYTFAHFLYRMMDRLHGLPNVGQGTKPLYTNMTTFLLTGQIFDRANMMGINPDLHSSPSYIGFQEEDVKKYGYFLRFVMNLPLYIDAIWDPKTAD